MEILILKYIYTRVASITNTLTGLYYLSEIQELAECITYK